MIDFINENIIYFIDLVVSTDDDDDDDVTLILFVHCFVV